MNYKVPQEIIDSIMVDKDNGFDVEKIFLKYKRYVKCLSDTIEIICAERLRLVREQAQADKK